MHTVVNRPKMKGTAYETSLLPLLREFFPGAERRALSGAKDKGDYILPGAAFALEAKNVKAMALGSWLDEATVEAENLGVRYGVVVHKRRGKTDPSEQFVTMKLQTFLELTCT
jgi:hypothetical protein